MRKATRFVLVAALCAMVLCGGVLAAGNFVEPPVTVQLNGEMLEFTDAKPQLTNERTFLPFYAVFNALGAEVRWNEAEPDKVVAVRDGKTLTMNIGSPQVTVEEGGKTETFSMDVAPYIDPTTDRTYVPVFFAADALDCDVGWDPDTFTAIIVDTDALVEKTVAGKSYTWLEKLGAYSQKYREGIWDAEMDMSGNINMLGAEMPMKFAYSVITADQTQVEMDMTMSMDVRQMALLSQQMGGEVLDPETQAMLDTLADGDALRYALRGDLGSGQLYMNVSGKLAETLMAARLPAAMRPVLTINMDQLWYSMDMNALMEQSGLGMSWGEYLEMSMDQTMDPAMLVKANLDALEFKLTSVQSYTYLELFAESLAQALSDERIVKEGNTWTVVLTHREINTTTAHAELILTVERDQVTAYRVEIAVTDDPEDESTPGQAMTMVVGIDEKGAISGQMTLDMNPMMNMDLAISGTIREGTVPPQTEPPAGAVVIHTGNSNGGEDLFPM